MDDSETFVNQIDALLKTAGRCAIDLSIPAVSFRDGTRRDALGYSGGTSGGR